MKEEKKYMNELRHMKETEKALDQDIKETNKLKEKKLKEEEILWKEYSKYRRDCVLIEDKQKR